jgi:outer membrane protein assembly factor BamB
MRLLFLLTASFGLALPALAADWPQWRGPNRDDVSKETGLLQTWPTGGPKLLWTFQDAGIGYSGPAIVGDRLYTMGADGSKSFLYALDVTKGEKVWSLEIGSMFTNGYGDGPRSTPTVDGDQIYAIDGTGELICADTSGKKIWQVSLKKDLGGQMMSGWGYSESPLVDGDKVLCTPGGSKGTIAALDKKSGNVLWRSTDVKNAAAYSSIIVAEVGGVRQYVQLTREGLIGISAADGKRLWDSRIGGCGTATIPTPIFHDGYVFATSGYGDARPGLVKLTADGKEIKAEEVYSNKNLANKHNGVLLVDGVLYGASEAGGPWVAIDFLKGDKLGWKNPNLKAKGSITYADGRLYLYTQDNGTAVLLEPDPKEWKEAGRFKIPQTTKVPRKSGGIWTHPVVANGRLYLRDEDLIFCYDVKANGTGNR